jgi:hypothetical protein
MTEQTHKLILETVQERFDDMLLDASVTLEKTIADRIMATTTVDELLELRLEVDRDFQNIIMNSIREFMPELDAIARDTVANTPGSVTEVDNRVANELKSQSYARLREQVNVARENVNMEIVLGALGGYALATTAQNTGHVISGLFVKVNDLETTRLQNRIRRLRAAESSAKDEIDALMRQLKNKFQNVSVGGGMYQSVSAEAHDMVMDFDGVFTLHRARQAGLKRFRYSGSVVGSTRDHCAIHTGKTYTEAEIRRIWSSSSWSGKRAGDPLIVRGGHNCRHFWIPVGDDK